MEFKRTLVAVGLVALLSPAVTAAFPFGGRANTVLQCVYNSTIYVNLGPPRGGEYIWTTGTRTYQFGPPAYAGQWLLGLAAPPYYCIYQISPLEIYTGIAITMMGSSGAAAPAGPSYTGGTLGRTSPSGTGAGSGSTGTGTGGTGTGSTPTPAPASGARVVVSEVYYAVDSTHGGKPANEWIELYNAGTQAADLSQWIVQDASTVGDRIPTGTSLAPGAFVVITNNANTRTLWNIPATTPVIALSSPIGNGLENAGDAIVLKNGNGTIMDALSWGTDKSAFNPSAPVAPYGHSLARSSLTADNNTASDWVDRALPTPGK